MKSEERHELKQNDLAAGLTDIPGLWARYGNKVLLFVTAALLVYLAVQYRRNQAAKHEVETRTALVSAWAGVDQAQRLAMMPAAGDNAKIREGLAADVNQNVQAVVDDPSAMRSQTAWAWLARGELYWAVSRSAAMPTTAPASRPATGPANDPLSLAANAYQTVVKDYAAEAEPAKIARFSLAAVAEERADWATARTQYKALIETTGLSEVDKSMATARLAKLDTIEKPTLLLPATQPAAQKPAFDPTLLAPPGMLSPTVGPFTPPAAPSTRPAATQPAASQPVR